MYLHEVSVLPIPANTSLNFTPYWIGNAWYQISLLLMPFRSSDEEQESTKSGGMPT